MLKANISHHNGTISIFHFYPIFQREKCLNFLFCVPFVSCDWYVIAHISYKNQINRKIAHVTTLLCIRYSGTLISLIDLIQSEMKFLYTVRCSIKFSIIILINKYCSLGTTFTGFEFFFPTSNGTQLFVQTLPFAILILMMMIVCGFGVPFQ